MTTSRAEEEEIKQEVKTAYPNRIFLHTKHILNLIDEAVFEAPVLVRPNLAPNSFGSLYRFPTLKRAARLTPAEVGKLVEAIEENNFTEFKKTFDRARLSQINQSDLARIVSLIIKQGHIEFLEYFKSLAKQASINIFTLSLENLSCLQLAIRSIKNLDIVNYFIANGAKDEIHHLTDLSREGKHSVLSMIGMYSQCSEKLINDTVKFLITAKADPNDSRIGGGILARVLDSNNQNKINLAKALIHHGTAVTIDALHLAFYYSPDSDLISLISSRLVDPQSAVNSRNIEGNTPLHVAISSRNRRAISLLLQHSADITLPNERKQLPIDSDTSEVTSSIKKEAIYQLMISEQELNSQINARISNEILSIPPEKRVEKTLQLKDLYNSTKEKKLYSQTSLYTKDLKNQLYSKVKQGPMIIEDFHRANLARIMRLLFAMTKGNIKKMEETDLSAIPILIWSFLCTAARPQDSTLNTQIYMRFIAPQAVYVRKQFWQNQEIEATKESTPESHSTVVPGLSCGK